MAAPDTAAHASAAPALLRLDSVAFAYAGREPIFSGVNLELRAGTRMGLLGANGSGKTTLLSVMVGLAAPSAGQVLHRGQPVRDKHGWAGLRREVGLLFQSSDDQLFNPTVLDDVAFGPLNLGRSPEEAAEAARATLDSLGAGHLAGRLTHQLSGGEKKLAALAGLLVMQPALLLLDEPTNDLDPATRERLIEILAGLPHGYLVVSHDLDFMARTTHELASLEHGRLNPTPREALHHHAHIHPLGDHPHEHGPEGPENPEGHAHPHPGEIG